MGLDFNAFQAGQQAVGDPLAEAMSHQLGSLQLQQQALQNQAARTQLQQQQIQLQRQQTFGQDMQSFLANPSATGVASLFGKYPEFNKQISDSWNTLDTATRETDATQLGSVASLIAKGDFTNAAKIVQTRVDADRKAGRDSSQDEQALAMLQSGDPKQQKAVLGLATIEAAGAVGPDKAAAYLKSLGLSQEPVTVGMEDRLVNPSTGETIVAGTPKLQHVEVTNADGSQTSTTFNPATGAYGGAAISGTPAEGGGQSSGGAAAAPAGAPRSVRNNNPGNLKATEFTKSQPGYTGVDDAGYATFSSPQDGLNAQAALLGGKGYYGGGRKTVAAIVSKWAPPQSAGGDNTNAQTANYVSYVAKRLGVRPGDTLTPQQLPQVAQAMAAFEAGATGHAGSVRVPPAQGGPPAPVGSAYTFGGSSGGLNTKGAPQGFAWNSTHSGLVPIPIGDPAPGDTSLSGSAYIANLSKTNPALANQVQGVMDTRLAYPPATARSPQAQALRAAVLQADPAYDEQAYKRRQSTIQQYTPGHAGPGASMLSAATLINHMYDLAQAARSLPDHSTKVQNAISSWMAGQTNEPWLIKFNEGRKFVASELPKFLNGKAPTEGEQHEHYESYSPSKGAAGIQTALSTDVDYLYGRYQPLLQAYKDNVGKDLDLDKFAPGQATSAKAAALEYYRTNGALPAVVTNPNDAAKLPHGALFATPDGRVLRRH